MLTERSTQTNRWGGPGLIALAATLWGTVGVTTNLLYRMSATNPLSVGLFRLGIAAPVLVVACLLLLGKRAFAVRGRDLGIMLLLGLAMALYQVCYFAAIVRLGVSVAVLIGLCTSPVMVALLALPLLGERLNRLGVVALVCALVGTALLVGVDPGKQTRIDIIGLLLALGTGLSYAVVTLTSRALAGRYHPLQPVAVGFVTGSLLLLPFALAGGLVLTYPPVGWWLLLYLGLVPTALSYGLFLRGIRTTSATVASVLTLLEPLTSTLLAWRLFDEQLSPLGLLGAALLLAALIALTTARS